MPGMFSTPYTVRFADVDNAGIFYYPRFFHMFHVSFEVWWERGVGRPYHIVIGEDSYASFHERGLIRGEF